MVNTNRILSSTIVVAGLIAMIMIISSSNSSREFFNLIEMA